MAENNFEQDVKDFFFKQMGKFRVFDSPPTLITDAVNFLCVSNKYGKVYVATDDEIKEIDVSVIENHTSQAGVDLNSIVTNYEYRKVIVGKKISHISMSCDDLTLAVVYRDGDALWVGCVDVRYFGIQEKKPVFFAKGQLATSKDVQLRELEWHPEDVDMASVCLSNGLVSFVKINGPQVVTINSLANGQHCYSVSWSPRGKNFVAGQADGRLMLYDRKMDLKKEVACPSSFNGTTHQAVKVKWLATHNFAAVFLNAESEEPPKFVCIVTQKDGPTNYSNMEDIYYGFNEDRRLCYYMQLLREWSMVVTMASNEFESVVIAKTDNQWMRWALDDSGRAEMPLSSKDEDTFPCGIGINLNSSLPIAEGESMLPPAPIFMMVSTDGVLCSFKMVNKSQDINHNILMQKSPMTMDNIKQPIVSSQDIVTQPSGMQSLPKPFGGNSSVFQSTKESIQPQSQGLFASKPQPISSFSTTTSNIIGSASNMPAFSFGSTLPAFSQANSRPDAAAAVPDTPFSLVQSSSIPPNVAISTADAARSFFPAPSSATSAIKPASATQVAITKPVFAASASSKSVPESNPLVAATAFSSARQENSSAPSLPVASTKPLFGSQASALSKQPLTGAFGASSLTSTLSFGTPALVTSTNKPASLDTQKAPLKLQNEPVEKVSQHAQSLSSTVPAPSMVKPTFDFGAKPSSQPGKAQQPAPLVRSGRIPAESRLLQATGSPASDQPKLSETPVQPGLTSSASSRQQDNSKQLQSQQPHASTDRHEAVRESKEIVEMKRELGTVLDKCIAEEIASFEGELRAFKLNMKERSDIGEQIGTPEEMKASRGDCASAEKKVNKFIECHVEHEREALQLKSQMLKAFDRLEEAKMQESKIYDRKYNALLKARSLDPVTARQRKEIRSQLNYVTALISDVNDSLDIAWEQVEMDGKRRGKNLKSNSIHNVYVAVESVDKIINNLANQIDAITIDAKKKQVISTPLASQSSFSRNYNVSSSEEKENSKINNASSVSNVKFATRVSPLKQSQLRDFLANRKETPIRRSNKEAFTPIQPKAASTPAVNATLRRPFEISPSSVSLETVKEAGAVGLNPMPQQALRATKPSGKSSGSAKGTLVTSSASALTSKAAAQQFAYTGNREQNSQPITSRPATFKNIGLASSSGFLKPKETSTAASVGAISLSGFSAQSSFAAEKPSIQSASTAMFGNVALTQPTALAKPSFTLDGKAKTNAENSAMTMVKPRFGGVPTDNSTLDNKDTRISLVGTAVARKPTESMPSQVTFSESISSFATSNGAIQAAKASGTLSHSASAPSSLFGGGAKTISGGLFGANASTAAASTTAAALPKPASTGLFGSSVTSSAPSSLFGAATQTTSGGLFGATVSPAAASTTAAALPKPASTGLFGSSATTSASSSLFGGQAKTTSGGLFGATVSSAAASTTAIALPKPASTGLFGSSVTSSAPSALFGGATQTTSGGLFGATASTAAASSTEAKPASTGLFGSSVTSCAPPSLFGGATQTTSGGLFGATASTAAASTTAAALPKPASTSLFGSSVTSSAPSALFGGATQTTSGGLFGATVSTVASSTTEAALPKPASTSLFGSSVTSSAPSSLFGAATQTTSGGLFGATVSPAAASTTAAALPKPASTGLFGSSATTSASSSLFGGQAKTTSGGLFGATVSSAAASTTAIALPKPASTGLFGSSVISSAPSALFGGATQTTSGGLFGATASTAAASSTEAKPASTGLFGSSVTSYAPPSLFGGATQTTSGGLFGATASTAAASTTAAALPKPASTSLFGSSVTSSAPSSLFGAATQTTSGGLFGATISTVASSTTAAALPKPASTGLFGSSVTSSAPSALFGGGTQTTSGGLFGANASTAAASTTAAALPKPASTGLFGSSVTSSAPSALFGGGTQTTSGGLFGATVSTVVSSTTAAALPKPASIGLFGSSVTSSASSSLFGGGTQTTSGGLFGASSSTGGLFGSKPAESQPQSERLFGKKEGSGTLFGGQSSVSSGGLFQTSSSNSNPAFGQSSSAFGSQQQQPSSGMGFGGLGLGGKPTNDPNKNPFGSVPSTSATSSGSNGFFGSTSSGASFGSKQSTAPVGSGSFSKGFGSGFASGNSGGASGAFGSQATGGSSFGAAPAFGGAPTFGNTPSFGGAPAFGSTSPSGPAFGSGSSGFGAFGQAAPSSSFGSLGGQNVPSFGSLSPSSGGSTFGSAAAANQPVQGFGNLGQQSPSFGQAGQQTSPPQGSSFSSWR